MTTGLEFKVFHAVGAAIARVTSDTRFFAFAMHPQARLDFSNTSRLFEVDLKATPRNVGKPTADGSPPLTWSDVKFDDRGVDAKGVELPAAMNATSLPLGITTLGSGTLEDLTRGGFVGAVYVEHDHLDAIRPSAIAPLEWPGAFFELYQITSVAYSQSPTNGKRAGKRYHGFRGEVTRVAGRSIQVTLQVNPGAPVHGPFTFDLDDVAHCDSDPPASALGGAPSLAAGSITIGKPGALFIALPRAAELGITGGKIPIGFDAESPEPPHGASEDPEGSPFHAGEPVATRISLGIASLDPLLALTMAEIKDKIVVDGALGERGVEGVVKQRLVSGAAQRDGCTLDLIAHAGNGVLQFGDWLIDAADEDRIDPRLVLSWAPHRPAAIRLLGCNTASTDAGQRAMRHLAEVFGVPIFGANVPLFLRDFDAGGLTSRAASALFETGNLRPVEPEVSNDAVERWFQWFDPVAMNAVQVASIFDRLRAETLDEATRDVQRTRPRYRWPVRRFAAGDRRRLLAQLVPALATAPGLLAVPYWRQPDREFEALFPAEGSPDGERFHRATILFGGRFVRIYPIDLPDGALLRSNAVLALDGGVDVPLPPSS